MAGLAMRASAYISFSYGYLQNEKQNVGKEGHAILKKKAYFLGVSARLKSREWFSVLTKATEAFIFQGFLTQGYINMIHNSQ